MSQQTPYAQTPAEAPQSAPGPEAPVVVIVGGPTLRAAVLNASYVVTNVVMLPAGWREEDPAERWSPDPGGEVVVLSDGEAARAVPGARRVNGAWVAPEQPAPQPPTPTPTDHLGALVGALRALSPVQAEQLQQLLAAPGDGST